MKIRLFLNLLIIHCCLIDLGFIEKVERCRTTWQNVNIRCTEICTIESYIDLQEILIIDYSVPEFLPSIIKRIYKDDLGVNEVQKYFSLKLKRNINFNLYQNFNVFNVLMMKSNRSWILLNISKEVFILEDRVILMWKLYLCFNKTEKIIHLNLYLPPFDSQ